LRRIDRLEALFVQAAHAGWMQPSEANALNFVAAAVRAREVGHDPARAGRQDDDPIGDEDRLGDAVGDHDDRRGRALPEAQQLEVAEMDVIVMAEPRHQAGLLLVRRRLLRPAEEVLDPVPEAGRLLRDRRPRRAAAAAPSPSTGTAP